MNARDNTPLRTLITLHLDSVESATAREITEAIGHDYPSRVIKELGVMRTDGLVECEPRGNNKEFAYWLAVPLGQVADVFVEAIDLPDAIKPGTRAAQIWNALRDGARLKASELTTMLQLSAGSLDPTLSDLIKAGIIARTKGMGGVYRYHRPRDAVPQPEVGKNTGSSASDVTSMTTPAEGAAVLTDPAPVPDVAASEPAAEDDTGLSTDYTAHELTYLTAEDYEMPPADPALLASANRMLCERMEGVAHALRDSGLPALANVSGSEDLQPHVVALSEAYQAALSDLQCRTESMHAACAALAKIGERLGIKPNDCGALPITEAIADLQNTLHSTTSAYEALIESTESRQPGLCASQIEGFVVRTSKRALKEAKSLDQANAAVESAIRSGARRAKAFALVPVSEAVLGVEWKKKA